MKIFWICVFLQFSLQAFIINSPAASGLIDCGAFFSNQGRISFRTGYEADFVFDGDLEKKTTNQRVDQFEQKSFLGQFIFNFCERFDLFANVGQSQTDLSYRIYLEDKTAYNISVKTHYDLAWAVGTSIILLDYQCLQIGAGASYFRTEPCLRFLKQNGEEVSLKDSSLCFDSIDSFFGLAFQTGFLVPYINFQYRKVDLELKTPEAVITDSGTHCFEAEENCPYGLVIGISLTNKKQMSLTFESRLFSEEAVSIIGSFRF